MNTLACAIYTRKSSEEGLDQAFNSLDAQREAGEAYIKSQSSEGWRAVPTRYDDGGFSGGTMERPGLKRLLADVEAGLVDVVVVYKIDRLTRSLADFARIVERFDQRNASFVSVTQAFNTTSSMGRLTLNVLLSFAQFEREVTGERIRDKIAASKAKGLWMGGVPPLGYDLPAPGTRTLQVNEGEAELVRAIFARYLELGSVHRLEQELEHNSVRSKQRVTAAGRSVGGQPFSRGALFHLLRNRIYLGQIVHKDQVYDGAHAGIVDPSLFDAVQQKLGSQARRHRAAADGRVVRASLTARLFDAAGEPMSPSFSKGRSGRIYRYYVSASLQQGGSDADDGVMRRVSAPALEDIISEATTRWMPAAAKPLGSVASVRLHANRLTVELDVPAGPVIEDRLGADEVLVALAGSRCRITMPMTLSRRGARAHLITGAARTCRPDPTLIAALRKAHRMLARERGSPTLAAAPDSPYQRKLLRLAFLAPDIQRAIIEGRQPPSLNLETLRHTAIPLAWHKQRTVLAME